MKPNTQAFIWTILMWTATIGVGLLTLSVFSIDPYQTPYTRTSIINTTVVIMSPFLITWLIGIATIYIVGHINK